MITEIPLASEFQAAGANQLYLAWQICLHAVQEYEGLDKIHHDSEDREEAAAEYWSKSQPALANAFGLVQQAMEMALKGRIAAVSPFLLIGRDPKDWPKGVDAKAVPFSEFRTIDAADLVKVHNIFCEQPLDDAFRAFWEEVRRDRNKIMHSIASQSFDPAMLIRNILTAANALFNEMRWPERLIEMQDDGKYAAYGLTDGSQNIVARQIETTVRHLTPAERKHFFGFHSNRRAYVCPACYHRADMDWVGGFPALAQFRSKTKNATLLHCVLCTDETTVERTDCINPDCKGNVVHDGVCMVCLWSQDSPENFQSDLRRKGDDDAATHSLDFRQSGQNFEDLGVFADDKAAIEHGRRAMAAPYLRGWTTLTIRRGDGNPFSSLDDPSTLLGTWHRDGDTLVWLDGVEPDLWGKLNS